MNLKKSLLLYFFFIAIFSANSQEEGFLKFSTVPFSLTEGANAIVRSENIYIEIKDYDQMVYTNRRIITILNKEGDNNLGAYQHYDKNINIKRLEAKIYNALGK